MLDESVKIKQRQFSLSLAYAMTIDKSQGQSLKKVGVILNSQCFSHGQLYTALSRPTCPNNLIIYSSKHNDSIPVVSNIVWKEVF